MIKHKHKHEHKDEDGKAKCGLRDDWGPCTTGAAITGDRDRKHNCQWLINGVESVIHNSKSITDFTLSKRVKQSTTELAPPQPAVVAVAQPACPTSACPTAGPRCTCVEDCSNVLLLMGFMIFIVSSWRLRGTFFSIKNCVMIIPNGKSSIRWSIHSLPHPIKTYKWHIYALPDSNGTK